MNYTPRQKKIINKMAIDKSNLLLDPPKNKEESNKWEYQFWNTQPINNVNTKQNTFIIDEFDYPEHIKLPDEYEWKDTFNVTKFFNFLNVNYVERIFDVDYLNWFSTFGKCLYVSFNDEIIGLILYIISGCQIDEYIMTKHIDVQLICIDKNFRGRGLFNVLVKELITRYKAFDWNLGTFYSNVYIPNPIIKTKCYYKLLNMTDDIKKYYGLKTDEKHNEIKKENITGTYIVKKSNEHHYGSYLEYMNKFSFHPTYDKETFNKIFRDTYEIKNENNEVDYFSVMSYNKKVKNEIIKVGRIINYTCNNIIPYTLMKLIINQLIDEKYDIIEMINMLESDIFYVDFGMSISNEEYYMYTFNWSHITMKSNEFFKLIL